MLEALFHVNLINIAKVRRGIFELQCQNGQQKMYFKKMLTICWGLYRLIPTQKHLIHSIPNNEVKVNMRSFILRAMKVEKTYEVVLSLNFENFQIKIKIKDTNCLLGHSHH